MNTEQYVDLQAARERGTKSMQRLLVHHAGRASDDVHAYLKKRVSGSRVSRPKAKPWRK